VHVRFREILRNESPPRFIRLNDVEDSSRETDKLHDTQANGAGTDNEGPLIGMGTDPVHGVATDGEGFHEGKLLKVQPLPLVQLVSRQDDLRAETPVNMNAEDFQVLAAVGVAAEAGVAFSAIQIRLDSATVAGLYLRDLVANRDDFHSQFMAKDPWVVDKRHLPEVAAQISTANTDGVNPHQRFKRTWSRRFRQVHHIELAGGRESQGFHQQKRERLKLKENGKDQKLAWPPPSTGKTTPVT
jgi:hypothetical protein